MADTEYWLELSSALVEQLGTVDVLNDSGLTVVRKGPVHTPWGSRHQSEFWLVSDPETPAEFQGRTVDLIFERTLVNPLPDERPESMTDEQVAAWEPVFTHKIIQRDAR